MLLSFLLLIPIIGIFAILISLDNGSSSIKSAKAIALTTSIINLFLSLVIFILFDFSTNQFQFVQEYHEISSFDFYLGIDGLSIYFVLLTTIIIPISLLSNWTSISKDVGSYIIIMLLLETLLLAVFLVLDILLFYIFFESILPPLFILIGIFGSNNRVKASFYLFLYTLLGSLFLLLSILAMSSIMGTTDFDTLYKANFNYSTQLFLFYGILIAFAVKTPTIFLNTWLLRAHVESPLGGSIILAAIVLKLSLYGILRLILPVLPKAYIEYTYIVYLIGVITIIYASLSTLRTIDVKELIAYSSVSHAAVYLVGVFSNTIQGIGGAISLGLAHGFVSPGLFICAGGILYDRSSTRLITFYRGIAQIMPLFAILFFILSLGNCGAPLTINFVGEFLSLYGTFDRLPLMGIFASSSIVFSAAFTIYMYNRISFAGSYSRLFTENIPDLGKREFYILLVLVIPTIILGIYPSLVLDGMNYSISTLMYIYDSTLNFNITNLPLESAYPVIIAASHRPAPGVIWTSRFDPLRIPVNSTPEEIVEMRLEYIRQMYRNSNEYKDLANNEEAIVNTYNSMLESHLSKHKGIDVIWWITPPAPSNMIWPVRSPLELSELPLEWDLPFILILKVLVMYLSLSGLTLSFLYFIYKKQGFLAVIKNIISYPYYSIKSLFKK